MLIRKSAPDSYSNEFSGILGQCPLNQEVHVFISDFDFIQSRMTYAEARSYLNENEIRDLDKIKSSQRFAESLYGKAALKKQLGCYLNCHPKDVQFSKNSYNKPLIGLPDCGRKIEFNISHSGKKLSMIFSSNHLVGIDIEVLETKMAIEELASIAERNFATEELTYLNRVGCKEYKQEFYKLWTLKEALLKALGIGLLLPLDKIVYDLHRQLHIFDIDKVIPNKTQVAELTNFKAVNVRLLDGDGTYSLAVASTANLNNIKIFNDHEIIL